MFLSLHRNRNSWVNILDQLIMVKFESSLKDGEFTIINV